MSERTYNWRREAITKSESRLRDRILTKSPDQLKLEREEAERDNDIRQLLRMNEGDNRPARTR